jgi:hypothetical protein
VVEGRNGEALVLLPRHLASTALKVCKASAACNWQQNLAPCSTTGRHWPATCLALWRRGIPSSVRRTSQEVPHPGSAPHRASQEVPRAVSIRFRNARRQLAVGPSVRRQLRKLGSAVSLHYQELDALLCRQRVQRCGVAGGQLLRPLAGAGRHGRAKNHLEGPRPARPGGRQEGGRAREGAVTQGTVRAVECGVGGVRAQND